MTLLLGLWLLSFTISEVSEEEKVTLNPIEDVSKEENTSSGPPRYRGVKQIKFKQ